MDYIAELTVCEVQDLDVAPGGQGAFDLVDSGFNGLFAVHEAGVDGKLAAFVTGIQQEVAEIAGGFALRFGFGGQIEHDKNPHEPISAEIS